MKSGVIPSHVSLNRLIIQRILPWFIQNMILVASNALSSKYRGPAQSGGNLAFWYLLVTSFRLSNDKLSSLTKD